MKIGPIGIPELLIILVVVLLIFGPKNLPKLGSALGKTVKNLREGIGGDKKDAEEAPVEEQVVEEIVEEEPEEEQPTKKVVRKTVRKKAE